MSCWVRFRRSGQSAAETRAHLPQSEQQSVFRSWGQARQGSRRNDSRADGPGHGGRLLAATGNRLARTAIVSAPAMPALVVELGWCVQATLGSARHTAKEIARAWPVAGNDQESRQEHSRQAFGGQPGAGGGAGVQSRPAPRALEL